MRSDKLPTINTTNTISHFLGHMELGKMIFLAFLVFAFQGTPAVAAEGKEELVSEITSREEVVRWAGYGEEKLSTVVIGGKLLCHEGSGQHKLSNHPFPVSGASVAVFCGTSGRTKRSWAKGSTDGYGEFLIDLPSHLHAIPNLEKICLVKVLHLPKSSLCCQAFTGKHKAIKLTSIGEGVRTYTTHDIHLMPKPSQEHMKEAGKREHVISVL